MKLIYQNPKKESEKSTPIDEHDKMRRGILEKAGWYVLERLEEGQAPALPVVQVDERKGLKRLDDALQALLTNAGYDTDAAVFEATDDELLEIEGIGSKYLLKIRNEMAKSY